MGRTRTEHTVAYAIMLRTVQTLCNPAQLGDVLVFQQHTLCVWQQMLGTDRRARSVTAGIAFYRRLNSKYPLWFAISCTQRCRLWRSRQQQ